VNLKLTFSAPLDVQRDAHAPFVGNCERAVRGRFRTAFLYRFYRKDLAGKRVGATAVGGLLFPGAQQEIGRYRGINTGVGWTGLAVTGVASRSYYIWAGATYQRYPDVNGNQRPDLITYTAVA